MRNPLGFFVLGVLVGTSLNATQSTYVLDQQDEIVYGTTHELREMPQLNMVQDFNIKPPNRHSTNNNFTVTRDNNSIVLVSSNNISVQDVVPKSREIRTFDIARHSSLIYICIGSCVIIICGICMLSVGGVSAAAICGSYFLFK